MNIIQKHSNPSGAYPPIQSWSEAVPPDGYYQVADGVGLSCGGFGELTVEDVVVTGFVGDTEAWEAWKAEHPVSEPPMTIEEAILDKLTELEYRQDLIALGLEGGAGV